MEKTDDFTVLQKRLINDYLLKIAVGEGVIKSLDTLVKSHKSQVDVDNDDLCRVIDKVFIQCVIKDSALDHFLKQKPKGDMWYVVYPDNLNVLIIIISRLLQGRSGTKSDGVNNYRLQFDSGHELRNLWPTIQGDFEKILKDFFNITPFLENQDTKNSFACSICFAMNVGS